MQGVQAKKILWNNKSDNYLKVQYNNEELIVETFELRRKPYNLLINRRRDEFWTF